MCVLYLLGHSKHQSGSNQQPQPAPVRPDEGYAQMKNDDNIAVADLLSDSSHSDNTGYVPYRDGNESDSSSTSSSSSSSSSSADSETRGEQLGSYKPVQNSSNDTRPNFGGGADLLEDFFSNPSANVEEANLLEFSTEENTEQEERPFNPQQYDPFSMFGTTPTVTPSTNNTTAAPPTSQNEGDIFGIWETSTTTSSSTVPPLSSTSTPSSPTAPPTSSSSFDPFGIWENTSTSPTNPTPSSPVHQMGFDPFGPSTTTSNNNDLLGFTTASTHLQPPSNTGYTGLQSQAFSSSNKSNSWSSFPDNRASSTHNVKPSDPFGDIWNQASGSNTKPQTPRNPPSQTPRNPSPSHPPVMTNRPLYNMGSNGGRGSSTGANFSGRGSGTGRGVGGANTSSTRPRSVSPNHPMPNKFGMLIQ